MQTVFVPQKIRSTLKTNPYNGKPVILGFENMHMAYRMQRSLNYKNNIALFNYTNNMLQLQKNNVNQQPVVFPKEIPLCDLVKFR